MDVQKFTLLLESTMQKAANRAGGMDHLTSCLSRPSKQLIELYGPMTDKVLKRRAIEKAQSLYDQYSTNHNFRFSVQQLGDKFSAISLDATNGAVSSMGALCHLRSNFASNLDKVLADVKEPPNKIEGAILALADLSITIGLSFIPVAGPFLAPLSQGISGALNVGLTTAASGIAYGVGDKALVFNAVNAQWKAAQKSAINNDNAQQDRADAAATTGKAMGDGVKRMADLIDPKSTAGQLVAQKGVASLIYTAMKFALAKHDQYILSKVDSDEKSFAKLIGGRTFSQNQVAAGCVNSLGRLQIEMPASLAADPNRTKKYLTEETSLKEFKKLTASMFNDFYSLLVKIMNSGLIASFEDAISSLNTPEFHLKEHKIALLLLGYFYSKDWDGTRTEQLRAAIAHHEDAVERAGWMHKFQSAQLRSVLDSTGGRTWDSFEAGDIRRDEKILNKFDRIERIQNDMRTTEGHIHANKEVLKLMQSKNGLSVLPFERMSLSARTALTVGRSASSKQGVLIKDFGSLPDLEKLPTFVLKAENYFRALKSALTADIETAMVKGNNGFLTDEEFNQMWRLFIGSQLIVNHALNDSKIKIQSSKVRGFFRALNPTTDATSIPEHYLKLIEDADFLIRYRGDIFGQVSTEKKKKLAGEGKMRWALSPSDRERAMLITFCSVVAFTMDVGKISLGFYNWSDTVKDLRKVCMTISETAWT